MYPVGEESFLPDAILARQVDLRVDAVGLVRKSAARKFINAIVGRDHYIEGPWTSSLAGHDVVRRPRQMIHNLS